MIPYGTIYQSGHSPYQALPSLCGDDLFQGLLDQIAIVPDRSSQFVSGRAPRRGGLKARPARGRAGFGVRKAPSRLALRGETAPSGRPPHPSRGGGGQRRRRWPPPQPTHIQRLFDSKWYGLTPIPLSVNREGGLCFVSLLCPRGRGEGMGYGQLWVKGLGKRRIPQRTTLCFCELGKITAVTLWWSQSFDIHGVRSALRRRRPHPRL